MGELEKRALFILCTKLCESDAIGVIRWTYSLESLKYVWSSLCVFSRAIGTAFKREYKLQMDTYWTTNGCILTGGFYSASKQWRESLSWLRKRISSWCHIGNEMWGQELWGRCRSKPCTRGWFGGGGFYRAADNADSCQLRSTCNVFTYLSIYWLILEIGSHCVSP